MPTREQGSKAGLFVSMPQSNVTGYHATNNTTNDFNECLSVNCIIIMSYRHVELID